MSIKKPRTTKRKKSNGRWHKNVLFAVVILAIVTLVGFVSGWLGYEIGSTSVQTQPQEQIQTKLKTAKEELDELRARLKDLEKNGSRVTVEKKDIVINFLTEAGDYGKADELPPPPPKKAVSTKPFIAIVIDDVAYPHQLKTIESLPVAVTPSIFPPAKDFGMTPKLARESKKYMVHLPMETKSHPKYALPDTLTRDWTQTQMENYIAQVRRWFPSAVYINNHTGSAFTESEGSMDKLYRALSKYGLTFVDSRTTPLTSVEKVAKKHGKDYIRRDVFLDNKLESEYIYAQLEQTVKIAKEHGSAMAIGHPHAVTLETIAKANGMFKDIDVVYIDEYVTRLYKK